MVRRVVVLCLGAALAAGLTILGYVGVDTAYPSPNCSLENCTLPIILVIGVPGAAAVLTLVLVRFAGAHASRVVLWLLGLSAWVAAVIFELPRALREPSGHQFEAAVGTVLMLFVYVPGATALLLTLASERFPSTSAPD